MESLHPGPPPSVRSQRGAGLSRIDPAVEGTGSQPQQGVCFVSKNDKSLKNENDLNALKQGALEVLVTGKTIFFRGASMDQASFLQLVTVALAPYDFVNDHWMSLHMGIAARDAQEDAASQFVRDARAAVIVSFGENSAEFRSFGFHPPKKPAPLTLEKQQLKNARAKATRRARGTLGPKQRKKIKGVVPAAESGGTQGPPSSADSKKA